jgi:hypothetical protein
MLLAVARHARNTVRDNDDFRTCDSE